MSNTKYKSNNIYLQTLIAEILGSCDDNSAMCISEIKQQLSSKYNYKCAYKTIARNVQGMSDHFKLLEKGNKPVRYWIDSYYEPDFSVKLSPLHLQLILYSIKALKETSTRPLMNELKSAEIALLGNLPPSISNELKYALKAYTPNKKTVSTISYPKNNIIDIFTAIRKRKLIKAKLKIKSWDTSQRHKAHKLAIRKIFFTKGEPFIEVYLFNSNEIKTISAMVLNSIMVLNEDVPPNILTKRCK